MDKEYIEREAAKNAFPKAEADAFENCRYCTCLDSGQIGEILDNIPAADVAPVVRCKDCKHYVPVEDEMVCVKDADWCVEDGCYYGFTESHDADWFCADGERKDGDGDV